MSTRRVLSPVPADKPAKVGPDDLLTHGGTPDDIRNAPALDRLERYAFGWKLKVGNVTFDFQDVEEKRGEIRGEIYLYRGTKLVDFDTNFNLGSSRVRTTFANRWAGMIQGFPYEWGPTVDQMCATIVQAERELDEPRDLGIPMIRRREPYHFWPLVREGGCSLIFGDGGSGKALALDTPIPTPQGWTVMGDIQAGDTVFDERGEQCQVRAVGPIQLARPCYRVGFSDGSSVVADAEHEWVVRNAFGGKAHGVLRTLTTAEMAAFPRVRRQGGRIGDARYSIDVAAPLSCDGADLLVDPYVLGCWLGDGHSHGPMITVGHSDRQIVTEIEMAGYPIAVIPSQIRENSAAYHIGTPKGERTHCRNGHRYPAKPHRSARGNRICDECMYMFNHHLKPTNLTPYGEGAQIGEHLRTLGVINNKHIPNQYLRASEKQRLALLQGLMDTDGYIGGRTRRAGACEIVTTLSEAFANQITELIRTLGMKPTVRESRAKLNGRDIGPRWRILFSAWDDIPVFRLERKRVLLPSRGSMHMSGRRSLTSFDLVPSVPVRCIEVDSPSHLYLAGTAMVPTHNSFISLWAAMALGSGCPVPSPCEVRKPSKVLYLDWEADWETHNSRMNRLADGAGIAPPSPATIKWLHMDQPLVDRVRAIRRMMDDIGADVVIHDSLSWATGGSLLDDDVARSYLQAVRRIGGTHLAIAHVSKDTAKNGFRDAHAFGSRFWHHGPRLTTYVRRGDNGTIAFLRQKSNNDAPIEDAWGLRFEWDGEDGPIRVYGAVVNDAPDLAGLQTPIDQAFALLSDGDEMSSKSLALALGLRQDHVNALLRGDPRFACKAGGGRGNPTLWRVIR